MRPESLFCCSFITTALEHEFSFLHSKQSLKGLKEMGKYLDSVNSVLDLFFN